MSTDYTPTTKEQTMTISIDDITLASGNHLYAAAGMCLLEAVSYIQGEPFSDHPVCVSPVLATYGRRLNDRLNDADRQRLKPYIHKLPGTAGDGLDEQRRFLAIDWAIRTAVPRWLDVAEFTDHATRLRTLTPITDDTTRHSALEILRPIRDELRSVRSKRRQSIRDAVTADLKKNPDADITAVAAAAAAAWSQTYDATYDKVFPIFRAKYDENPALAAARAENITDGIELLGRMIDLSGVDA